MKDQITVEFTQYGVPRDWRKALQNIWHLDARVSPEWLGAIPAWVHGANDERSMVDMIHQNYSHGGGWIPFDGFHVDPVSGDMTFDGDPDTVAIGIFRTEHEVLWFYPHSWITVKDIKTGEHRTARID